MINNTRFLFILLFTILLTGFNNDDDFLNTLRKRAELYNSNNPVERVFIQTDRSFYKPGDLVWFKALLQNTSNHTSISRDLFIKLIDVFGNQALYLRYPVFNNESNGYLIIPPYIKQGKYNLLGYTSWMKNQDYSNAFSKEIIVSNSIERKLLFTINYSKDIYYPGEEVIANVKFIKTDGTPHKFARFRYVCQTIDKQIVKKNGITNENGIGTIRFFLPENSDIDFTIAEFSIKHKKNREKFIENIPLAKKNIILSIFAEGGNMIAGEKTQIAFKAEDVYGFPVDVEGIVVDEQGEKILPIKSSYKGLGKFIFTPEEKKYKIQITKPANTNVDYYLPEVKREGIKINFIGIENDEIILSAKSTFSDQKSPTYWVGEENREICWSDCIYLAKDKIVKIPVQHFKNGMVKFTVFNDKKLVIAERTIYIPSEKLNNKIKVECNNHIFFTREKVQVKIEGIDGKNVKSSLSVVNNQYINKNEISADLYFNFITTLKDINPLLLQRDMTKNVVDLITMTHQVISLPLQDLFKTNKTNLPKYYNQNGLVGQVLDKKKKPVNNAKIKVFHLLDMNSFETESNDQGIFNIDFYNNIINFKYLNIAVVNDNGKSNTNILLYDYYSENLLDCYSIDKSNWPILVFIDLVKFKNPDLLYTGNFNKSEFKETAVEQKKQYDYERYSKYTNVLDILKDIKSFSILNDKIVFSEKETLFDSQQGALIVIDGIEKSRNIDILNYLSPKDIRDISIVSSPSDIPKYSSQNKMGLIEITTIRNQNTTSPVATKSDSEINNKMMMIDYQFSLPDYSLGENPESDKRITLYWESDLLLKDEREKIIEFHTSDIPGSYTGSIQGTLSDGQFFTKEFRFRVE